MSIVSEPSVSTIQDRPHVAVEHTITPGQIDGVNFLQTAPAVGRVGITIEAWRRSWPSGFAAIEQINLVVLQPGVISAWHLHRRRFDAVLVVAGALRLALFDVRPTSTTHGAIEVVTATSTDHTVIIIPPSVLHGVQVLGDEPVSFLNCFDQGYDPADPDEWRLPFDSDEVPYRFP